LIVCKSITTQGNKGGLNPFVGCPGAYFGTGDILRLQQGEAAGESF